MLNKAVTIALIITLVYGYLYSTMKEDFGFSDDPLDPYFSLMTMSTVEYGDFFQKRDAQSARHDTPYGHNSRTCDDT